MFAEQNNQNPNGIWNKIGRREIITSPNVECYKNATSIDVQIQMVSITVYDSEGFVVYRDVKSMSSVADFLLPNLDPAEDYTIVATIDGETYVMEMIP